MFDRSLEPVTPDEEAVRLRTGDGVELSGVIARAWRRLACRGVDDAEDPGERLAQAVPMRPARHAFGHRVEIGDVAPEIGAEHGLADQVERGCVLLFQERRLAGRSSLRDPVEHVRGAGPRTTSRGLPRQVRVDLPRDVPDGGESA